jgi:HSP20 family molecular chaperone IbpA
MTGRKRNPLDEALSDMMDAWMEMIEVLPIMRTPTMPKRGDKHTTFGEWEDRNGEVSITVDMPGVQKKDITLSVDAHMVSVEADAGREYNFQHEFPLITLNPDEVTAKLNNGVLDIKIKKAKDSVGKSIDIE